MHMFILLVSSHLIAAVLGAAGYALVVRRNPSVQTTATKLADAAAAKIDKAPTP